MAINIKKESGKVTIELNNGHTAALEKIVKDYNLLGEKEALSFMLSVISDADGGAIKIPKGSFVPSEEIQNKSL